MLCSIKYVPFPAMGEDGEVEEKVQKLRKELKKRKKEKKELTKKLEESEKQKEEIKNSKKEKRQLTKKLEDSERQRADLEELLQIKMEQQQSSLNQHTEQIERQCRLVEVLQNQTERLQGYFREYEGMF